MNDDANYISKVVCTFVFKRNTFLEVHSENCVVNTKQPENKIMEYQLLYIFGLKYR